MDERLQILKLIETGEISVEEGARRLEALTETPDEPDTHIARPAWVQWLWQATFWTGIGLVAGGGLLLGSAYTQEVASARMTWGWILFILGVLGLGLGWWLQRAHWFSLRIRQADGPNISFALPLPLGLIAWGLRVAAPFVPQLEGTGVDELILAMREEARNGCPFFVQVDEGAGGEQIRVHFG